METLAQLKLETLPLVRLMDKKVQMRQHLTAQTESTWNDAIYQEHISKVLVNERMGENEIPKL